MLVCNAPSLMKSPEHPWAVWFPCFHIVLTAGLQKPAAITGLSTSPAVIIFHIAGTTVFRRSCSETSQMQTLHGETLKCNAWGVIDAHHLLRHHRRAICIYPGCRNPVMGRYQTKCRYTVMQYTIYRCHLPGLEQSIWHCPAPHTCL